MNIEQFWGLIERVKDIARPEEALKNELRLLSPNEIGSFKDHFDSLFYKAEYWLLWGAAYLIGGGCSDDGFIDFRYGLIASGKDVYYKALENPDSLVELGASLDISNELFGYTADGIYKEITGNEMPDSSENLDPVEMGEEWDFDSHDECKKRLPKLTQLHWC